MERWTGLIAGLALGLFLAPVSARPRLFADESLAEGLAVAELDWTTALQRPIRLPEAPIRVRIENLPQSVSAYRWEILSAETGNVLASGAGARPEVAIEPGQPIETPGVVEFRVTEDQPTPVAPPISSWQRFLGWNSPPPVIPVPAITRSWTWILGEVPNRSAPVEPLPDSSHQVVVYLPSATDSSVSSDWVGETDSPALRDASELTLATLAAVDRLTTDLQAARRAGAAGIIVSAQSEPWWLDLAIRGATAAELPLYLDLADSQTVPSLEPPTLERLRQPGVSGMVLHHSPIETGQPVAAARDRRLDEVAAWRQVLGDRRCLLVASETVGGESAAPWLDFWRASGADCVVLSDRGRASLATLSGQFRTRSHGFERTLAGGVDGVWMHPMRKAAAEESPGQASDTKTTTDSRRRLSQIIFPASWRMGGATGAVPVASPVQRDPANEQRMALVHDFCQWVNQRSSFEQSKSEWLVIDADDLADATLGQAVAFWRNWLTRPGSFLVPESPTDGKLVDVWRTSSPRGDVYWLANRAAWPQRVTLVGREPIQWDASPPSSVAGVSGWTGVTDGPTQPERTPLETTFDLAATSWTIVRTGSPSDSIPTYRTRLIDSDRTIADLTQQVTLIVERLGLLNEPEVPTPPTAASAKPSSPTAIRTSEVLLRLPETMGLNVTTALPKSAATHSDFLLQCFNPVLLHRDASMVRFACGGLIGNGDFESSDSATDASPQAPSGVSGWMHAQHPAGVVRLDQRDPFRGKKSVQMRAGDAMGSQAWLISPSFPTPTTGRVAVSMALKSADGNPTNESVKNEPVTAQVRVAIEGAYRGQPCRRSVTVDVPVNGVWQPSQILLEWLDVDAGEHTDLRLTIDNLSPHDVWIDEVYVTDWFASRSERAETQSLAYLAVQGLQKSDLTSVAQLLQNFWADQLLQVSQTDATAIPIGDESSGSEQRLLPEPVWGRDSASPKTTDDTSTATRRWRDWIPQPLRF